MRTESNLFRKLYKYSTSEDQINAKENFFSEAFSILLEDRIFARSFIKKFANIDVKSQTSAKTQSKEGKYFVDIKVESMQDVVFIESKIDSPVSIQQLNQYLDLLETHYELEKRNRKLLLITRRDESQKLKLNCIKSKHFEYCRWSDVYLFLSEIRETTRDDIKRFVISNLLDFMEDHQMDSFSGFTKDEISRVWPGFLILKKNIDSLQREMKEYIQSYGYSIL